jgi:MoaA/NifB/PqqE/SkfB family radical SAM enzyme
MKSESFASADVQFPPKVIANSDIYDMIMSGELKPYHLQLNPTNKCNLKCEFCSCRDEDKNHELSLSRIKAFCSALPTIKAVTITGGGEPTLYPQFDELCEYFYACGIKMGLVTNGYKLNEIYENTLNKFIWCRISLSIDSGDKLMQAINYAIFDVPVDWAFSFVCSKDAAKNAEVIKRFYGVYSERITHMRVVGNILEPDGRVQETRDIVGELPKVIWQGRDKPTRGDKECRLAMIKPVLSADGKLYPCCGTQYYKRGISRQYSDGICIGDLNNLAIFNDKYFDGSVCDVCFYSGYNKLLKTMTAKYEHIEFV